MITVIAIYLLYLLTRPGPVSWYRMQGRKTLIVNVISCPSKVNTWRFKNISCNQKNEPKQYTNQWLTHGKLQRCQTQQSDMHITAEIMQTYDPLKFALARSNASTFLLITQYEMPFINKKEASKSSKDRKLNGKCTNARTVGVVFSLSILFTFRLKHLASWKLCFSPKQTAEYQAFSKACRQHTKNIFSSEKRFHIFLLLHFQNKS